MKTSLINIAGALLLAFSVSNIAKADPITGEIDIAQSGSQAVIDFTANTVSFLPSAPGLNATVSYTAGSYNSPTDLLGSAVSYSDFTYSPFVGPETIWQISGSTYFILSGITSVNEVGGLVLHGTGTAYLSGFDATVGSWSFSANNTGTRFAFSSTNTFSVPDGGTTALLVGLGLVGMGAAAYRRKKA